MLAFNWLSIPVGLGVIVGGLGILLLFLFIGVWLSKHEEILMGLLISCVIGIAMVVGGGIMNDTTTQGVGGILFGVSLALFIEGFMIANFIDLLEDGR